MALIEPAINTVVFFPRAAVAQPPATGAGRRLIVMQGRPAQKALGGLRAIMF